MVAWIQSLTDLGPLKHPGPTNREQKPPVAKVFARNHPLNVAGVAALTS